MHILLFLILAASLPQPADWVRSPEFAFYLPGDDVSRVQGADSTRLLEKYHLANANAVNNWALHATYLSWEQQYAAFIAKADNNIYSEADFQTALAKYSEIYNKSYKFEIKTLFYSGKRWDLSKWKLYLQLDDSEVLSPDSITGRDENPIVKEYEGKIREYQGSFTVSFPKLDALARPRNMKLVLDDGKVKRGFEWRFDPKLQSEMQP
jgi:hypothetical protein